MPVLLTGGTGFIGAHVARALCRRQALVRCLVRPTSRRDNLADLEVDLVEGDLGDPRSLTSAMQGCREVYHCAADYRLYSRRPHDLYTTNVDGTRNILRAALEAGVEKVVYTSSVGALGLSVDGSPADEESPVSLAHMVGHYKRSKYLAERVAEEYADKGLPVVIVNPSTPVGELDIKPTPTGRMIVDFLNGRMPAYVATGLNLVDVRDVAEGHLLAAEHGRIGEKYILGCRNLSLQEILATLAHLTGLRAPRIQMPHWLPFLAAAFSTASARLFGGEPRVSLESVRMSRDYMYFDSSKAVRELGFRQTPIEDALERAVSWFRARGYTRDAHGKQ